MTTKPTPALDERGAFVVAKLVRGGYAALERQWANAISDTEIARGERDALIPWARLGYWCLEEMRENLCDLDGGGIQDRAQELGLLVTVVKTEPCCDACQCAEVCDEWPTDCLRMIDVPAAIDAMRKGGK